MCADAYVQRKSVLVQDVDAYPGHIACDGETKSEVVCPLLLTVAGEERAIGVLDLDCLGLSGFDERDRAGLEKIAKLVVDAVRAGLLPRCDQRLSQDERRDIRPGDVYVWTGRPADAESGSPSLERWTDGAPIEPVRHDILI